MIVFGWRECFEEQGNIFLKRGETKWDRGGGGGGGEQTVSRKNWKKKK